MTFVRISTVLLLFFVNIATAEINPPPVNQVFIPSVSITANDVINIHFDIKKDNYLYKSQLKFAINKTSDAILGKLIIPVGEHKNINNKNYIVYPESFDLPISILAPKSSKFKLNLQYQGCSNQGFCYPPVTKQILISSNQNSAIISANIIKIAPKQHVNGPKQDFSKLFNQHNILWVLMSFFGFGLLLAFTPCILPVIPILSAMIVGQKKIVSSQKAFLLSVSYVLSMAVSYAIIGIVIASVGANLQVYMQTPFIISLFGLLFIILACSMFGLFELKLPNFIQVKIAKLNQNQQTGSYSGVIIMGALSTLILSPCVSAPLVGALTYIAHHGNLFLGGGALFCLGIGMGTPLILITSSAARFLPTAGPWMNLVKGFFGVVLLGMAIYIFSKILPGFFNMILWGILFIGCGVFINYIKINNHKIIGIIKIISIVCYVYGSTLIIGGALGNNDLMLPLGNLNQKVTTSHQDKMFPIANNLQEVKQLIEIAKSQNKPVMLDFYATWCNSCKWMDKHTFQNLSVREQLSQFNIIKVDLSTHNLAQQELMKYFNVIAPPTFIFYDKQGKIITNSTIVGEESSQKFLAHLLEIINRT